ncbi:MAG: DNA-3-methyladenine glycosylase I [Pseudomonadales bacterium]|nr:DNA-3-methyladenine glycosylase I [Pseudomonadales bacterium]
MSTDEKRDVERCTWCGGDDLYMAYHDEEWGVPLFDDQKLFEFLILEGAQAGLSWITVLRKRENYRAAFDDFNPEKIAGYEKRKINQLMNNEGIIRNQLKIKSTINNAQRYLDIQSNHSSFSDYLWQFVEGQTIQNQFMFRTDVPAKTPLSDIMAKTMKKAGFNFVGSTICYAFMQATGMVNDHLLPCYRHQECADLV